MLKEYSIADIVPAKATTSPCYAGTFEGTNDPDIEWPHRHSFYSLVWFTRGEGFYVIDFQEYEIKPYRLFLVSPRQIHNWDYAPESEGYVLIIDAPFGTEVGIGSLPAFIDPRHLIDPRWRTVSIISFQNMVSTIIYRIIT